MDQNLFGAGTYTANNNALHQKGLAMRDYYLLLHVSLASIFILFLYLATELFIRWSY